MLSPPSASLDLRFRDGRGSDSPAAPEASDSRALCYVNGHQIKADNEPQQLCDRDRLVLGNCTPHVISFHAPGGATGSNSSGGGRGVGSFTGAVREVILQRLETREKSW